MFAGTLIPPDEAADNANSADEVELVFVRCGAQP